MIIRLRFRIACRCLGLLLGVDQKVMPLFDFSAVALSMLVFSGRRDLRAYVVRVAPFITTVLMCQVYVKAKE